MTSDWPEMAEKMKEWAEWRSVMMRPGGQSVMTSGPMRMLVWLADSLGSMIKVCKLYLYVIRAASEINRQLLNKRYYIFTKIFFNIGAAAHI